MTKLSDTQLMVLSRAAARDDGVALVPEHLPKGAVIKVGTSLVRRKLMREVRAKPGMSGWRQDEHGRRTSLIITRAGRDAIGLDDDAHESQRGEDRDASGFQDKQLDRGTLADQPGDATGRGAAEQPCSNIPVEGAVHRGSAVTAVAGEEHRAPSPSAPVHSSAGPRPGSKQALVIGMLSIGKGATIADLAQATGWLPHTTRAVLTGLRKKGFVIERLQREGERACAFRIAATVLTAA